MKKWVREQKADNKGCRVSCHSGHLIPGARAKRFSKLNHSRTELVFIREPTAILSRGLLPGCWLPVFVGLPHEWWRRIHRPQRNAAKHRCWVLEVRSVCPGVVRVMGYEQGSDSLCYIALSPWLCSGVSGLGCKFWVQHWLALWPWTRYQSNLSLLHCRVEMTVVPTSQGYYEDDTRKCKLDKSLAQTALAIIVLKVIIIAKHSWELTSCQAPF